MYNKSGKRGLSTHSFTKKSLIKAKHLIGSRIIQQCLICILKPVLAITTENKEFEQNLKYRVVCDVCIFWLGASLEQFAQEGPVAIAYAFRFPISLEENYSVNELELLGLYGQSNTPIINCTVKKNPPSIRPPIYNQCIKRVWKSKN